MSTLCYRFASSWCWSPGTSTSSECSSSPTSAREYCMQICENDGIANKICRSCRKSLEQAYDFKLLIERSDAVLYKSTNMTKINFSNLNEVKIKIEVDIDCQKNNKYTDIEEKFKQSRREIHYSDTIIKKIENYSPNDVCLKPVPILEFLKTIDDGLNDDEDDYTKYDLQDYDLDSTGVQSDDDGNYIPPSYQILNSIQDGKMRESPQRKRRQSKRLKMINRKGDDDDNDDADFDRGDLDLDYIPQHKLFKIAKSKKKNTVRRKHTGAVHQICIKPVFIKDLKLIHNKPRPSKRIKKNTTSNKNTPMVCPYCGLLKKNLKSHILIHSGKRNFKCDVCLKAYFTEASLRAHKQESHAKTRNFKCDKCTAAFNSKSSLNSHKTMHNPELKYACDVCDKVFKRAQTLRRHRLGHNAANKTVMCDLCNMTFFTKYNLRHHLRIHTRERPYKCELCSQPYSYKRDFNRHCLKKHGVFINRRAVYVMNNEVLEKERMLIKDLMLRRQGIIKDDNPINPFESPHGALAFADITKALESNQIPIPSQF